MFFFYFILLLIRVFFSKLDSQRTAKAYKDDDRKRYVLINCRVIITQTQIYEYVYIAKGERIMYGQIKLIKYIIYNM